MDRPRDVDRRREIDEAIYTWTTKGYLAMRHHPGIPYLCCRWRRPFTPVPPLAAIRAQDTNLWLIAIENQKNQPWLPPQNIMTNMDLHRRLGRCARSIRSIRNFASSRFPVVSRENLPMGLRGIMSCSD